jgi:hypothetical protein
MFRLALAMIFTATMGAADAADRLMAAAHASFNDMPTLTSVAKIVGRCGADESVNQKVDYCTSSNTIVLADTVTGPQVAYLVAHSLGHAVQVQHGIADIALKEITQRRAEETVLRGYVASQVDCIAGFLVARAGLSQTPLFAMFKSEPFTGVHWGRDPLTIGPSVAIGLDQRDDWFRRGYLAQTLSDCAAGEFGADLLLRAYKG